MMMMMRSNSCCSSCSSSSLGGKGGRGDVSVSFSSFSRRRRKKSSHFRRRALSSSVVNEVEVEVNERAKHYFTKDSFYAHADKLYSSFQNNHSNAKKANAERFCWDYWHVENQYTQLRTPAKEYYYEGEILNEFYAKFEEELLKYARENLALSNFTPIWMSCYVDGMGQELHADVPHGRATALQAHGAVDHVDQRRRVVPLRAKLRDQQVSVHRLDQGCRGWLRDARARGQGPAVPGPQPRDVVAGGAGVGGGGRDEDIAPALDARVDALEQAELGRADDLHRHGHRAAGVAPDSGKVPAHGAVSWKALSS